MAATGFPNVNSAGEDIDSCERRLITAAAGLPVDFDGAVGPNHDSGLALGSAPAMAQRQPFTKNG
jgi:hypothetical protein